MYSNLNQELNFLAVILWQMGGLIGLILMKKYTFEKMETGLTAITQKSYSLHEVMLSVQSILQKTYVNRQFWVRCEISRISLHNQSGHCYLELIDKNETSILAQQRGIIWSDKYYSITEKFRAATNSNLSGGMKVLFLCSISFHPMHGLSLNISDIEPSFTLGEMARSKNESIARLKAEGLYNKNRSLKLPVLPKRIAVISVITSRGYQDFVSTIENYQKKFSIHTRLFEAILQGDNAVPTIINAMRKIISYKNSFDAIVIIRGGAGEAGLSCYDEFSLSSAIAESPLPVITGIGHASNETVVEMISFKNCITPTAAATFLLEHFEAQSTNLNEFSGKVTDLAKTFLKSENNYLMQCSERFNLILSNILNRHEHRLLNLIAGFPAYLSRYFLISKQNIRHSSNVLINVKRISREIYLKDLRIMAAEILRGVAGLFNSQNTLLHETRKSMDDYAFHIRRRHDSILHLEEKIAIMNPANTLQRGYSITRINGKAIIDAINILPGDKIETELAKGKLISTVK